MNEEALNTNTESTANEQSLPASLGLNAQLFVFQLINLLL